MSLQSDMLVDNEYGRRFADQPSPIDLPKAQTAYPYVQGHQTHE